MCGANIDHKSYSDLLRKGQNYINKNKSKFWFVFLKLTFNFYMAFNCVGVFFINGEIKNFLLQEIIPVIIY